ncbi:hypothetical protein GKE82_11920 [Conexibacter sp. W3-3-2]|uniref:hypothetical protein n=1 Tax=Conexibacter sp. W3-3-2 TaxID=2675227 RepID=UPI0012B97782|nr:hypothetical protein [Conexibacter sp. W3-3-2]MTD44977.1 hypothetical protein [Conexibacter sp. W3-3-2]
MPCHLVRTVETVARAAPREDGRIRPDLRLRLLAEQQHALVARWQLERLRIGGNTIDGWLERQRLRRVHRGVYSVAGRLDEDARRRWLAAVLLAGPGSALSHTDGVALHRGATPDASRRVHVTTIRPSVGGHPGVHVHASRRLGAEDLTVVDGIPVTTLARCVYDGAAVTARKDLVKLLNDALADGALTDTDLDAIARRRRGLRGKGPARFASARAEIARLGVQLTRSDAEQRLLAICDEHGLPRPTMNHRADGYEIDAAYVDLRVGIEIDSFGYHLDRESFVRDRRKLRALQRAGWTMLPFAAVDLQRRGAQVAAEIDSALDDARGASPRRS